ncbi:MAG: hypothetical protein ACRDKH_03305 [Solirubrobacterales bacterium]
MAAVVLLAALSGGADLAEAKVLGAARPAAASCPDSCVVEARVSGFQTDIDGIRNPFRIPAHGRIVAWSIKLGKPAKEDLKTFNGRFGPSQARISILKPVKTRRGRRPRKVRYRLLRQSPIQDLQPFFGETTTFGLADALKVRKGNIVALTMPTWAPAFAVGQEGRWRASRKASRARGPCFLRGGLANIEAGGPHDQTGTQRRYGCGYRGARLLYSARFLPAKRRR